ncbi:protein WVD2-like 7 isoform X2 [Musa acuminata AAA Group]|uniref:protein WVD2-like 7 isoform X2 n=1 Tax=Musa acuminata AAA Group TaxID=214697 RepID=UPI0031D76F71
MMKEIEDSISYQAETISSGSISFGRFEAETMSWERRSSFSHNRYLEEVEKYATPGSVTQKKAYFEAHFKKKPLLHHTFPGFQSEAKLQFAENCAGNHTWNVDDSVECGDDGQVEYTFFEAPLVSDEHEVTKCEQEEVLSPNFSREYTPWNSEELSDRGAFDYGEAYQVQSNITPQDGNDMQIVAKENHEHETSSPQELLDGQEFSSKIPSDVKNKTPVLNKMGRMSTEVPEKVEKKFAKGKLRNQLPDSQTSRKPSTYKSSHSAGKTFPKKLVEVERGDTEKMQPQQRFPARISRSSLDSKNHKAVDSEKLKARVGEEKRRYFYMLIWKLLVVSAFPNYDINSPSYSLAMVNVYLLLLIYALNSEKCISGHTVIHVLDPLPGKCQTDIQQSADRCARVPLSDQTKVKHRADAFKFRSDQRAEKRKEFYMKLEEKMHVKEAEMNEIQARTQEEADAEIKQLRKSLNFKATPMPSFYNKAAPAVLNGKKVAAMPASFSKSQNKTRISANRNSYRDKSPVISRIYREGSTDNHQETVPAKKIQAGKKDEKSRLHAQQGDGSGKKEARGNMVKAGSER